MQPRMGLGLGILIFFLLLGMFCAMAMDSTCTPISQMLSQAARESDPQQAMDLANTAKAQWDKKSHAIAILADHTPMDEIDSLFSQAMIYAQAGNTVEFSALCHRISSLVDAVYEAHSLNWWNIL